MFITRHRCLRGGGGRREHGLRRRRGLRGAALARLRLDLGLLLRARLAAQGRPGSGSEVVKLV